VPFVDPEKNSLSQTGVWAALIDVGNQRLTEFRFVSNLFCLSEASIHFLSLYKARVQKG